MLSTNLFATDPNIPAGATSASCDNSTLNTYSGTSNLQANWEANKVNLSWYSDDAQITDVQSAATSCNYDGTLTVPSNTPTKVGYTFNGWKVRGLPSGYTRLEYIELTGTQYINTGIVLTDPTNIEQGFWVQFNQSKLTDFQTLFGFMTSSTTPRYGVNIYTGRWMLGIGTTVNSSSLVTSSAYTITFSTTQNTQTLKSGAVTLVSTSLSSSVISSNTLVSYFGARNNNGSVNNRVYGKLGRSYLKQNNTLLYDYIPAKRNSDNVVGMWDTVSGTFKTNAGTGTFGAGPVVQ